MNAGDAIMPTRVKATAHSDLADDRKKTAPKCESKTKSIAVPRAASRNRRRVDGGETACGTGLLKGKKDAPAHGADMPAKTQQFPKPGRRSLPIGCQKFRATFEFMLFCRKKYVREFFQYDIRTDAAFRGVCWLRPGDTPI